MAQGVFESIVSKPPYEGLISNVDSCGTGAYHVGSSPDSRTTSTLKAHGIVDYNHTARKVRPAI
jgi:low molecular weight phosphotyrosine protein phosphatase